MKDKKRNYHEPAVNVVKMKHCARLLAGSDDATDPEKDPHGEDPNPARQNDMLDD